MLQKTFLILLISLVAMGFSFAQQTSEIKWVTVNDIAASLEGKNPMNVGFDVDDTVLFSSPGFYYGKQKYSPNSHDFLKQESFWEELNNGLDVYSIPKESARKIIDMHKKRGDTIFFITARPETKTEKVTEILAKVFSLENPQPVIFTGFKKGENHKVKPILENKIQIYYGDSDGDIEAALEAKIRGIRIIRAGNSTHKPLPKNGALGEEVVVNSAY